MDFLIITGLSGAGKSRAADVLEDLDYYCVDNLPVALMPKFAELCIATGGRYEKVALVTDVRAKNGFDELLKTLDQLKDMNCACRILYMDADVPTIVKRYKETRRPHPLAKRGGSIEEAVYQEMDLLAPIRERADFIVNSSTLTLGQLQSRLFELIAPAGAKRQADGTYKVGNLTYDGHSEAVTVEVADNGDGKLTATAAYDADGARFTNTYKPDVPHTGDPTPRWLAFAFAAGAVVLVAGVVLRKRREDEE